MQVTARFRRGEGRKGGERPKKTLPESRPRSPCRWHLVISQSSSFFMSDQPSPGTNLGHGRKISSDEKCKRGRSSLSRDPFSSDGEKKPGTGRNRATGNRNGPGRREMRGGGKIKGETKKGGRVTRETNSSVNPPRFPTIT